ncbi:MAG: HdeD family acid-resistance protein [Oscillospiraceae bacterium]
MLASKRFKLSFAAASAIYILLGLFLILAPSDAQRIIVYIIGGLCIAMGLLRIAFYFIKDDTESTFRADLAVGVVLIGVGLFLFNSVEVVWSLLPVLFGFTILYDSVIKFQNSFDIKRASYSFWWVVLILSVITAILSFLLIFYPFKADILMYVFGSFLVLDGIVNIFVLVFVQLSSRRIKKGFTKAMAAAEAEAEAPAENTAEPAMPEESADLTAENTAPDTEEINH